MTWRDRFRHREGFLESLWGIPVAGAVVGVVLGVVVSLLDARPGIPDLWVYSPSTATAVLTSILGATSALTGFVVTVTVLVVQMAVGTFSARILRLWFRDPLLKATLALLVGTLTFSFGLLRRIDDDLVPNLGITLAGVAMALCLLAFILFFDRCIRQLRPVSVAADVARSTRATFAQLLELADRPQIAWDFRSDRPDPTLVVRADRGGAIQGVDTDGMVRWAVAHRAQLVVVHPVGDFVHTGGELVRVVGGSLDAGAADQIRGLIALGDERTFDQDPAFGLRVMVDMANRALSAAVNDPTTATQVMNHIGEVLEFIGRTDLSKPTRPSADAAVGLVMAGRSWEDYVTLALTEIRGSGAGSVQVMRRMRSLLDDLLETVRPENRAAVRAERDRLDATIAQAWSGSVDIDRASVADRQGIGGATGR